MTKARDLANIGADTADLATDAEVALKAPISNPSFTGTVTAESLGIGTSSPNSKLDIEGSGDYLRIGDSDGRYIDIGHWISGKVQVEAGNGPLYIKTQGEHALTLGTNNVERITVLSGGNVGINVEAPETQLAVGHASHGVGIAYSGSSIPRQAGVYTSTIEDGAYGSLIVKARTDYGNNYSIHFQTSSENNAPRRRMTIDKNGAVTKPYQPAFAAYNPLVTSQGNDVIFSINRFNTGGHYNSSNGRFTAPVAGKYIFTYSLLMRNNSSYMRILFAINGVASTSYGDSLAGGGNSDAYSGWSYDYSAMSVILPLNAGDYVTIENDGPQTTYGESYGQFSGYLLG